MWQEVLKMKLGRAINTNKDASINLFELTYN